MGAAAAIALNVVVRVAICPGEATPVQAAASVREHVAAANEVLAPHGITVTAREETFRPARCDLLARRDRDAMAKHAHADGAVPVLVVARVRDLDVPSYDLMGVHWRGGGRRWIFLTARAKPPVLVHELAHFFGLPHDPAGGNLMTPGPSSPAWKRTPPPRPFQAVLTAAQAARLRAGIADWQSRRR